MILECYILIQLHFCSVNCYCDVGEVSLGDYTDNLFIGEIILTKGEPLVTKVATVTSNKAFVTKVEVLISVLFQFSEKHAIMTMNARNLDSNVCKLLTFTYIYHSICLHTVHRLIAYQIIYYIYKSVLLKSGVFEFQLHC